MNKKWVTNSKGTHQSNSCSLFVKFVSGVIDPTSNEEVSMQKAVMLGIINSANGTYVNSVTGETYPIPVAMNAGLIKVQSYALNP